MSTRRILLLLVSLFASVAMMAQNVNVTVKLADASNDEPIGFATVSLTPEKGSAKYSLTDNNGKGTIEKVKVGKYTFKAEIMGYKSYEKAVEILEQNGVTRITGEGRPFDFNLQNAVAHVSDGDLPENTVKQVMQAGYMYQGKVLRTAQVIVAN